MRPHGVASARGGLTVYEVFLSLTLLLGALAVLSQHISVGARAGVRGRLQTQAAMLAETKLAEVLGGIEPMSPVGGIPLQEAGAGWVWAVDIVAGPTEDLLDLSVTVSHADARGEIDATFTLRRLVRDPQVLLDMADAAAEAAAASTTPSSSTSSTSGTSPPSGGMP